VTNKYLQATSETKRSAQDKLVGAILPTGLLSQSKTTLFNNPAACDASELKASRFRHSATAIWGWGVQLDPDWDPDFWTGFLSG
jgi:hypothetical protein